MSFQHPRICQTVVGLPPAVADFVLDGTEGDGAHEKTH